MKKLPLVFCAVLLAFPSYAQSTLYSNSTTGNVGIGTTSPANSLDVSTGGGVHITSGVPGSTSMALYNNSGTLTWNGSAIGTTGSSISGTTNYIPYFTGSASLGNSVIYQSGSDIGIGTTSPGAGLDIGSAGATLGTLRLEGNTSGYIQLQPAAAAGSWTMTLPSSAGTSGYVLQTDGTGVTSWAAQSGGGVASSAGRLQCGGSNCSNSTHSTTLNYCPYKGNVKTTASQGNYTIPSGCLTATTTSMYVNGTGSTSLSANTTYYIYLWDNSGTWVLDASTTGHATDSSTGIEIKSGDNTRTLVGLVHTDGSSKVATGGQTNTSGDTNTVATWDNRIATNTRCQFSANRTLNTPGNDVEISSENRCYFISWGDAAIFTSLQSGSNNTSGNACETFIVLDSAAAGGTATALVVQTAANYQTLLAAPGSFAPTEGYHFTELWGNTTSGTTCTWLGAANAYTFVYTLQ